MVDINSFGLLGGDRRQAALADALARDGCTVCVWGLDGLPLDPKVRRCTPEEIYETCAAIILPLPATADGRTVNAPYADRAIALDDEFAEHMMHKEVYGGRMASVLATSEKWDSIDTYDYYTREEFAVRNAGVTAEGAIAVAVKEYEGSLLGSSCLVVGYGRIGRALAQVLRAMGARVTASARRPRDFAWIELSGCTAIATDSIGHGHEHYDVIFNTVPALIFPRRVLAQLEPGCVLIDLASKPGGVDFSAAKELGIHAVQALSLPGKTAPRAAAEIIKNTIYNMMEE